jgi:predicted DNA-binding transcriptional regulator AlpA
MPSQAPLWWCAAGLLIEPLVIDARQLAAVLCVSVRTVRSWDAAGKLPAPIRIGGRVLWRAGEVRDWIDAGAPDRAAWEAGRGSRDRT